MPSTLTRVVTAALGRSPEPRVAGGQLINVAQTADLQRIMRDTRLAGVRTARSATCHRSATPAR